MFQLQIPYHFGPETILIRRVYFSGAKFSSNFVRMYYHYAFIAFALSAKQNNPTYKTIYRLHTDITYRYITYRLRSLKSFIRDDRGIKYK